MASGSLTTSSDALASYFEAWHAEQRTALIPYLAAGYPTAAATLNLLRDFESGGADLIELGVPFSDPVADGPTIQRASQRALEQGTTLGWTLDQIAAFRRTSATPVLVFSYLNPILRYGAAQFLDDAVAAGAQGVLLVDLPVGADPELEAEFEQSPLSLVRLLAPTTPAPRAQEVARRTQGFLYYVARLGVTGARGTLRDDLIPEVQALKQLAETPVVVGFGISSAQQASEIARVADGVVVGSALIDALDQDGPAGAVALLRELRAGLDRAS